MHTNPGFVAGAFYFDEWWKNSQFNPVNVNTTISPLNPQTGEYQTNSAGQVTMKEGTLAYPGYPFTHDAVKVLIGPKKVGGFMGSRSRTTGLPKIRLPKIRILLRPGSPT
jgi:hypothetical protein